MIEYALRYVEIKPPRDIGNDEIYSGLASLQGIVDKYMPESIAKGAMKKGMSTATKINKAIDVLMWYRLMAGAKLIVFERELEKAIIANSKLPLEKQKSQHELAKMAGQFVNDAFGGQNWRRLAENVDNAFGRKWAAAMASENGMKWANLVMFAPDWTVSNLRVLAKVFPGIEKDPIARKMYQRYALRAAIYYATIGAGIQMMLTGKPIWENDDPTKLDLGDGRTMTFSKQVMEPFHWVKNPIHEATVKQSSLLKGIEEQVLNKEYIGGRAGPITTEDDPVFTAAGKRLKIAGQHFAPIFVQDIGRNGPEGVYGFFGHPIYGHIRYGFKKANGELE
ncbi:MAG: hypothetical protein D6698_15150 [Gammaproteobacteria bacterium]|nr:MAG: hypothetical protein D6698_15150 [Gammaproteobacteria bacterium]